MKKIGVLIMILLSCPVIADTFFEPEWSEFCPSKYVNIDENVDYISSASKYWAERKRRFNKRVAQCKNLEHEEQQRWCYSELRQIEAKATRDRNEEVKDIRRAIIWGW